jgi:hypothetical protein
MPERIDARPLLAVVGGALLLVSLFVTWYDTPATPPATGSTEVGNAWEVFEVLDLILAAIAIAAIYAAWEQFTGRRRFGEGGWLLPVSVLGLVIVASQILDSPPGAGALADPTKGAWIALGAVGVLVIAGVLGTVRVSLAVELEPDSNSTRTTRRQTAQESNPRSP